MNNRSIPVIKLSDIDGCFLFTVYIPDKDQFYLVKGADPSISCSDLAINLCKCLSFSPVDYCLQIPENDLIHDNLIEWRPAKPSGSLYESLNHHGKKSDICLPRLVKLTKRDPFDETSENKNKRKVKTKIKTGTQALYEFGDRIIIHLPGAETLFIRGHFDKPIIQAVLKLTESRQINLNEFSAVNPFSKQELDPLKTFGEEQVFEFQLIPSSNSNIRKTLETLTLKKPSSPSPAEVKEFFSPTATLTSYSEPTKLTSSVVSTVKASEEPRKRKAPKPPSIASTSKDVDSSFYSDLVSEGIKVPVNRGIGSRAVVAIDGLLCLLKRGNKKNKPKLQKQEMKLDEDLRSEVDVDAVSKSVHFQESFDSAIPDIPSCSNSLQKSDRVTPIVSKTVPAVEFEDQNQSEEEEEQEMHYAKEEQLPRLALDEVEAILEGTLEEPMIENLSPQKDTIEKVTSTNVMVASSVEDESYGSLKILQQYNAATGRASKPLPTFSEPATLPKPGNSAEREKNARLQRYSLRSEKIAHDYTPILMQEPCSFTNRGADARIDRSKEESCLRPSVVRMAEKMYLNKSLSDFDSGLSMSSVNLIRPRQSVGALQYNQEEQFKFTLRENWERRQKRSTSYANIHCSCQCLKDDWLSAYRRAPAPIFDSTKKPIQLEL
ncbi:hypothetical protein Ciccas_005413 [Cichlidogyrus casuarinus]|uniref:RBD domain-containing protein n=1 Tax=Cichlidogyrus casuarinus TaxID=1844966 RepID=A0ABD2Q9M2_9PLAT